MEILRVHTFVVGSDLELVDSGREVRHFVRAVYVQPSGTNLDRTSFATTYKTLLRLVTISILSKTTCEICGNNTIMAGTVVVKTREIISHRVSKPQKSYKSMNKLMNEK